MVVVVVLLGVVDILSFVYWNGYWVRLWYWNTNLLHYLDRYQLLDWVLDDLLYRYLHYLLHLDWHWNLDGVRLQYPDWIRDLEGLLDGVRYRYLECLVDWLNLE